MDTALISRWAAAIVAGVVLGLQGLNLHDTHAVRVENTQMEAQISQELAELHALREKTDAVIERQQEMVALLKEKLK
jgi:hypothetical protein